VALATDYDEFVPMESTMPDVMTLIPGMYPTGLGQRWPSVSYEYEASPAPQPQVTPVPSYAPAPSPVAPVASSSHEYVTPAHAGHVSVHHPPSHHSMQLEPPITLPIHPPPPPPPMTIERGPPITLERGGPFRHSVYSTVGPGIGPNIGYSSGHPHSVPFQTSIFRK
jgi:ubiquitin thioesterase protein OTUB1